MGKKEMSGHGRLHGDSGRREGQHEAARLTVSTYFSSPRTSCIGNADSGPLQQEALSTKCLGIRKITLVPCKHEKKI